jgi:hypothetical protein
MQIDLGERRRLSTASAFHFDLNGRPASCRIARGYSVLLLFFSFLFFIDPRMGSVTVKVIMAAVVPPSGARECGIDSHSAGERDRAFGSR